MYGWKLEEPISNVLIIPTQIGPFLMVVFWQKERYFPVSLQHILYATTIANNLSFVKYYFSFFSNSVKSQFVKFIKNDKTY